MTMPASQRVALEDRPAQAQSVAGLELAIQRATAALLKAQRADGHWVFELEADVTIPAEHIALHHFLGNVDRTLERELATFLRRRQCADGGWSLVYGGPFNISASVKAYLALKLAGD